MESVLDAFRLDGDVALVTGAASGIGRGISEAMAEAGASVAVVDVDEDGLAETVASCEDRGTDVLSLTADVSEESAVEQAVAETVDRFGGLDAAFANAGVASLGGDLAEFDMEEWDAVTDVNLRGAFLTNKHAAGAMTEGGSIVNTASIQAFRGSELPGLAAYNASKGGVVAMTKQLAAELGEEGIRVNAIAPGWVHTGIGGGFFRKDAEGMAEFHEGMAENTALGRLGEPADLKGIAVFLASDASGYVTGATHVVDGGWTVL
jgi:NAD(P)-dependent dehydrogenase (short-subunit alcohol dehydrogenase family)